MPSDESPGSGLPPDDPPDQSPGPDQSPDDPLPTAITYYAIVDEYSSREHPAGVLRRVRDAEGHEDQVFSRDLTWEFTPLLYSAERGDGDNHLYKIPEPEAKAIITRLRPSTPPHP